MRHMYNELRFWKRPTTFLTLTAGMAAGVLLMSPGGLEAANPTLEAIQSQISGLPPTWDKTLPANDTGDPCNSSRFTCVMGGKAVRDNETGLVWEQSPATSHSWSGARGLCAGRTVGGRKGWRLPSVHELASLVDPANSNPALPTGHPFSNVQSDFYWSATAVADDPTAAWGVGFSNGVHFQAVKTITLFVWCVRGAMNADQY